MTALGRKRTSKRCAADNALMNSLTGKCACGAVRFRIAGAPIAMLNCHCEDCQRSSGAPFASGVVVASAELEVSGALKTFDVQGSSGRVTTRSFCPQCGTPLFTRGEVNPQFTSIRFPAFDDTSGFAPMLDIWTSRAQPWVCLDSRIPHFPESPPQPG